MEALDFQQGVEPYQRKATDFQLVVESEKAEMESDLEQGLESEDLEFQLLVESQKEVLELQQLVAMGGQKTGRSDHLLVHFSFSSSYLPPSQSLRSSAHPHCSMTLHTLGLSSH